MTSVASISGYQRLAANDYASLMRAVATVGPIAISVSAGWRHYEEGVYDDECGSTIDHAVQLVGYGRAGKLYTPLAPSPHAKCRKRLRPVGAARAPCA